MAKRIKTNIRFYTEQDPYHADVDNLPLYDLADNDAILQEQVDDLVRGVNAPAVPRSSIEELRPYLGRTTIGSNEYQAVFVKSGRFLARINSPAEINNGLEEVIPNAEGEGDLVVDAVSNLDSQTLSKSVSGVGRTAVVEFRQRPDNTDQYALIEPFNPTEWTDSNPGSVARIDVVYIRAYPAVDQNGNSVASAPDIGILKGAGILTASNSKSNQNQRFTNALGTKAHMVADSTDNEGYGFTLSGGTVQSEGSIPIPEDLLNSFEARIIRAEGAESYNASYLPVAYIVVPSTYLAQTDSIPNSNICDIRPFFRTSELTLRERQAIMFSVDQPSIINPFATESSVKKAIGQIVLPEPEPGKQGPPGKATDAGVILLGLGVIRGGKDYGPEYYFPEANAWYPNWDGRTDWDIIDQGYQNPGGNLKVGTAAYSAARHTWLMESMALSKKTVGVTLPEGFSYYYVDAEYLYSTPINIDAKDNGQADWRRTDRDNFISPGLTVHINPTNFTIITAGYQEYGKGGGDRSNGRLQGAYTFLLDFNGNPAYYNPNLNQFNNAVVDARFGKTRSFSGTEGLNGEGFIHMLPTVVYKVYAVKDGYLTTGATLNRIV